MNAIVQHDQPMSVETLETVLGTGDLSKLTARQRVEYLTRTCQALGLNPLTRPLRFMNFQGQTVLFATRDCADQLRASRKISLTIADKRLDDDLFIVTVSARTPDGRQDEDVGAVTMGKLVGEARANAIMKAMTKAKRRVTLSICGLGFLDESEVETLEGAVTYSAEAEPRMAPQNATSSLQTAAADHRQAQQAAAIEPAPRKQTVAAFLDGLDAELARAPEASAVAALMTSQRVSNARSFLRNGAAHRLSDWTVRAEAKRQMLSAAEQSAQSDAAETMPETMPETITEPASDPALLGDLPEAVADWPMVNHLA